MSGMMIALDMLFSVKLGQTEDVSVSLGHLLSQSNDKLMFS